MRLSSRFAASAVACLCVASVGVPRSAKAEMPLISLAPPLISHPPMLMLASASLSPVAVPALVFPAVAPAAKPTRTAQRSPAELAALVADHAASDTDDNEHECIANAVYFEANGEPLEGELAVAQVILNRARSGRFATSACGVVRQAHQFSFVRRGGIFPAVDRATAAWQRAVAIAEIARDSLWKPVVRGALYFGCGSAGKTRLAALGRHVFYR